MKSSEEMSIPGAYTTIVGESRSEITIKRSVFIGCCLHASTKTMALDYVDSLRAEFRDANHVCYAYRFGPQGMESRAVDDGEPSGSAGKPILFYMHKANVSDVVVAVVRYFGGIRLGVGGLARAYTEAARLALESAPRKTQASTTPLSIICVYDDMARITTLLESYSLLSKPTFADAVSFDVDVPTAVLEQLKLDVMNCTNGRAGYTVIV